MLSKILGLSFGKRNKENSSLLDLTSKSNDFINKDGYIDKDEMLSCAIIAIQELNTKLEAHVNDAAVHGQAPQPQAPQAQEKVVKEPAPINEGKLSAQIIKRAPDAANGKTDTLQIEYSNLTNAPANITVLMGGKSFDKFTLPPRKIKQSNRTTGVSGGFTGKTITITHDETGKLLFEQKF